MYYLNLVNQLHLIIVLACSAWLIGLALLWPYDGKAVRIIGVVHVAPFLLTALAFITAPADRNNTEFLAYFAGFANILLLPLANMTADDPVRARRVELIAWFLPVPVLILEQFVALKSIRLYLDILMLISLLLGVWMLFTAITRLKPGSVDRTIGMTLVLLATVLYETTWLSFAKAFTLLLLPAGYIMLSRWLWSNTTEALRRRTENYERTMERINQNINREVVKRVEQIEQSNRKLLEITKTDNLTGAFTKAAVLGTIDSMIARAPNAMFSLMLFDLDYFKAINDTQGHLTGDKCLKQLAAIARASFRTEDMIGRYGGDEFMILLPGANPLMAGMVAERFRQNVEKGSNPGFTVSIGISTFPQDAKDSKGMVETADRALYVSKRHGRNRVTHVSQMTEGDPT